MAHCLDHATARSVLSSQVCVLRNARSDIAQLGCTCGNCSGFHWLQGQLCLLLSKCASVSRASLLMHEKAALFVTASVEGAKHPH